MKQEKARTNQTLNLVLKDKNGKVKQHKVVTLRKGVRTEKDLEVRL